MDQSGQYPPSGPNPSGSYGAPAPGGGPRPVHPMAPPPPPPAHHHVVHVVAKPGGIWRAVSFVIGLCVIGGIFITGIIIGVVGVMTSASYEEVVIPQRYREGGTYTVAIIPVNGVIDQRQAEFVHAAVNHVLDDGDIEAVVLRVDSPGGEVAASDQIWNEMRRLKSEKIPVIASYGGVAASGGYYVSCGANYIMAEETCITGSIGVIAQVMTFEELMGKIGVQPVTLVASGSPEKDVANDLLRTWNEQDKAKVRMILDNAYAIFNHRVRDGRKNAIADESQLNEIANGSIYTAQQAKDNGLIDGIGYLDDAIAQAEQAARLAAGTSTVIMLRNPPSLFGSGLFSQATAAQSGLPLDASTVRRLMNELSTPRPMYLMH
jgi:protease-4